MATLPSFFIPQFLTDAGVIAAGYKLHTYDSGTTTPKQTFTDEAGAVPNSNPIVLDSAGRCILFLGSGQYTFVLKDPADAATIWTRDDVEGLPAASGVSYLPLAGGTMTGLIVLSGNATANLNPTPLQQVNSLISAATASLNTTIGTVGVYTSSGGTSTAYTLSPSNALAGLTTGAARGVIFHTTSGANPTMAVSGLAAKSLKQYENGVKVAAKIVGGQSSDIVYDGTDWVVSAPQYGAIGTIAASGSVTFGGGLIVKWGTTGVLGTDSAANTVTFPTPFPTACFVVFANPSTDNGAGVGTQYSWNAYNPTVASFKINNDATASAFTWLAIGN